MKSKPYIDSVYGYPGEFSELEYFHLLSLFFYFFFPINKSWSRKLH